MNFSPSQFLVHFCSRHDRVDKPQDLCYHTVGGYMNKSTPGKLKGREQEVVEAYLRGLSSPEVARQFLVSNGAIKACLQRLGIPRREKRSCQLGKPRKTHCRKGHARTSENVTEDGHCKTCATLAMSRRYIANKSRCYEVHKQWVANNRQHATAYDQDYRLQKNFGITVADREAKRVAQDNKCKICGKEFIKTPHTDHDHETGQVRDLLCTDCNLGLGRFFDNPTLLDAAAAYCRRWKEIIDATTSRCTH